LEINELNHPDSIWTWKSHSRRGKTTLWLPYFQQVTPTKGKRDTYCFEWNAGEVDIHLKDIDSILLYGASGDLPVKFLDKLSSYKIPLLIHRRNMPRPYCFLPSPGTDTNDIVTQQILKREHLTKRCYIARTLVAARLAASQQWVTFPKHIYRKLRHARSVQEIREIEAHATRRLWREYFKSIGTPGVSRRDSDHRAVKALDACSFFFFGILLRWVLVHRLSPSHGFLHENTAYAALIYDLMEPYRYIMEHAVAQAVLQIGPEDKELTPLSLSFLRTEIDERKVYIPASRQVVRQKNLLHGIVLALRAYLSGEMKRFVIPQEGSRKGGRPIKTTYRLPGNIPLQ